MRRDLGGLADTEFDVVVIGGGVSGATMAWDAALRGLSVALLERTDFCAETSAWSLKVVHGGIRYLQHLDFKRVRESCRERSALLRIAPAPRPSDAVRRADVRPRDAGERGPGRGVPAAERGDRRPESRHPRSRAAHPGGTAGLPAPAARVVPAPGFDQTGRRRRVQRRPDVQPAATRVGVRPLRRRARGRGGQLLRGDAACSARGIG